MLLMIELVGGEDGMVIDKENVGDREFKIWSFGVDYLMINSGCNLMGKIVVLFLKL